jgi:hypothetical protein
MKITLDLATDERIALRRLMAEHNIDTPEMAAHIGLRDFLIMTGYLEEPDELDEDTETLGES